MEKLNLSKCEIDPDQGTYFITSQDEAFQDYVKNNISLGINWINNWIRFDYDNEDLYHLEVDAHRLTFSPAKAYEFTNCVMTIDVKKKFIDISEKE